MVKYANAFLDPDFPIKPRRASANKRKRREELKFKEKSFSREAAEKERAVLKEGCQMALKFMHKFACQLWEDQRAELFDGTPEFADRGLERKESRFFA